jgi:hypothetical protein
MKKYYTVLSPIRFDGKDYAVGSQIDLEDAEAEGLHEGAIDGTAKEITPLIAPTDEAERIAAVVAAIAQMDTGNSGQWLKDGKPKTDALSALTGWPVTAADRDAAWATCAGQV